MTEDLPADRQAGGGPPADPAERSVHAAKTFPCDEALRARVRAFRDESVGEWTNGTIGAEVGYTNAVLSQYLSDDGNKYNGDTRKLERRLREWVRDRFLMLDSQVPTIGSEIAQQIERAIEDIRTAKRAGVIIGAPGIGKSRGLAWYCATHERAIPFSAITWECNLSSAVDCLFRAADVARLSRGLNAAKILVERMRGTSRPILIDDAHKLTRQALQFFYDFRDATGAPVVFLGTEKLIAKLADDGQRLRRTGLVFRLKVKDPTPLIKHHIRALAPDVGDEEKQLIELCREIAEAEGVFGSVQMELSLAARIKRGKPEWSWCECVRRAHKKLIRTRELSR